MHPGTLTPESTVQVDCDTYFTSICATGLLLYRVNFQVRGQLTVQLDYDTYVNFRCSSDLLFYRPAAVPRHLPGTLVPDSAGRL